MLVETVCDCVCGSQFCFILGCFKQRGISNFAALKRDSLLLPLSLRSAMVSALGTSRSFSFSKRGGHKVHRQIASFRLCRYRFRASKVVSLLLKCLGWLDNQIQIGTGDMAWTLGAALYEEGRSSPRRSPLLRCSPNSSCSFDRANALCASFDRGKCVVNFA